MNKRGGIPDGIFYLVAIFAVSIISVVGFLIFDSINTEFQQSNTISPTGKGLMSNLYNKYVGIIDNAFLIMFVGILIGTAVGVWFIKTHPALFWIMIPIFAFIIFLSAIYANVFFNFTQNAKVLPATNEFLIIPFIMQNYAYIMTGVIVLIAILLFSKGKAEAT
jgi:hypothetical protein|tara:strand:+ start:6404 stop:6895 length:492 start_codon:yes stop_codon:yes gene_type:complete